MQNHSECRCVESAFLLLSPKWGIFKSTPVFLLNTEHCEVDKNKLFFLLKINWKKNFLQEVQDHLYQDSSEHLYRALSFLPHPNGVRLPALTTSFQLFFKVHVQYSPYLLVFLVSKELSLRLQKPQGGNNLFLNILSSH